jgi:hypothetical protein
MRSDFLASSVAVAAVIAIALLVELATVKEGLTSAAPPLCQCKRPVQTVCRAPNYYFMEIQESPGPHSLSMLLRIHKSVYPVGIFKGNTITESNVWDDPANAQFKRARIDMSCSCPGDRVCFPQYYQ